MNSLEANQSTVVICQDETRLIKDFAEAHNVSPYILFLAATSVFASRKVERNLFYIGTLFMNRAGVHERNTAGLFANGVLILVSLDETTSFAEFVTSLNGANFSSFRHASGPRVPYKDGTSFLPCDLWVSYHNATFEADEDAVATQYYCNYASAVKVLGIEDHAQDGSYKLRFDHILEVTD